MAIQMALGMLNRIAIYLTFYNAYRTSNLIKMTGLLVKHVLPHRYLRYNEITYLDPVIFNNLTNLVLL